MTDPQRGAYTPQNESLSFDARAPVRGSRPVPMTLTISAVVLVTLIVAGPWLVQSFMEYILQLYGSIPQLIG